MTATGPVLFIVCPECKRHATLYLPDGSHGVCNTKQDGRAAAYVAFARGRIQESQLLDLLRQIETSPLVDNVVILPTAAPRRSAPTPAPGTT